MQKQHGVNIRAKTQGKLCEENYICNRQFCSFCLKTQYEVNFLECCKNKSWICPFCQGVCFCTRCLRQDTLTQLKAYFIALGGDLINLLNRSKSIFDQMILQNFNTHLSLTLLTNPTLVEKFPNYQVFMRDFMASIGLSSSLLLQNSEGSLGTNQNLESQSYASNKAIEYVTRQISLEDEVQSKFKNNTSQMIAALKRGDISILERLRVKQSSEPFLKKREAKYLFKSNAAEEQTRLIDELRTDIDHAQANFGLSQNLQSVEPIRRKRRVPLTGKKRGRKPLNRAKFAGHALKRRVVIMRKP